MRQLLLITALIVSWIPTSALSQDIASFYFNRSYWETFDWERATESTIWKDAGFRPFDAPPGKSEQFHHNQIIKVKGKVFVASLAEYTKRVVKPHFTTLALESMEHGDCERLATRLSTLFGSTPSPISNKYFFIKGYPLDEVVRQWQVGTTRISLRCSALGPNKTDLDDIFLTYEAAVDANKIEAPIHLLCVRTYKLSSDQHKQQLQAQPLALSIIPDAKVVADAELIKVGSIEFITSQEISLFLPAERIDSKYLINRIDGTLTGEGIARDSGRIVATYSGSCEARKHDARKF